MLRQSDQVIREKRRWSRTAVVLTLALLLSLAWRLHQLAAGDPSDVLQRGRSADESSGAVVPPRYLVRSAEVMATRIDVTLPRERIGLAERVFAIFRGVDARMSEWKETSPLAAVNRAVGAAPTVVPADLFALLERSVTFARLTEGAFDPTWAALWDLWDFSRDNPRLPGPTQVKQRAALVDYRQLDLDARASTVRLRRAGMKLGLGGIAKGYALDQAATVLRTRGLKSFMISAGGQVLVAGRHGDRPWRVGIRDPRGGRGAYVAVLALSDSSVSTSGDYERYFERDGVRYHHILDPRSGMPARGLRSATVISPDATLADALSTALMVLGRVPALALVEKLGDVEAVLIDDQGRLFASSGARRLLVRRPSTKLSHGVAKSRSRPSG